MPVNFAPRVVQWLCLLSLLLIAGLFSRGSHANPLLPQSSIENPLQKPVFLPVEEAYQLHASIAGEQLFLDWQLAPGYYLYKHRFQFFSANNELITTPEIHFDRLGMNQYDEYYQRDLEVFYDSLLITLPIPATLQDQQVLLVESQACADAGLCYPPRKQVISLTANSAGTDLQVTEWVPGSMLLTENLTTYETTSFALIVLFALLGGLILNLMPCVFPVLSIKVLKLTSYHSAGQRTAHSIAYTLGIVLSFTFIALVMISLRAAGNTIGWGFQLQSPIVVTLLIYLFVMMGLSFSGFFYMGSRFMSLGQDATGDNNLRSSFLAGVLAAVVASPCSAPFMGTAIGYTLTQNTAVSISVFAFLGLGMALPFLLLGILPQLARFLPRAGAWMETLKQFLAFPLYLSGVWLLWVLGHQANADMVAAVCVGLVLLVFAIWVTHREEGHKILARTLAGLSLIFALLLPWHVYQSNASFEAPLWQEYSEQRLNSLLQQDNPVFVNVTADWCITCLVNEQTTLSSDEVTEVFRQAGVIYLKADWTRHDPQITRLLNRHQRGGVPLYLYFPAGSDTPTVLPQIINKNIVISAVSGK